MSNSWLHAKIDFILIYTVRDLGVIISNISHISILLFASDFTFFQAQQQKC